MADASPADAQRALGRCAPTAWNVTPMSNLKSDGAGDSGSSLLERLFEADRAENRQIAAGTSAYANLRERDADRREQVRRIVCGGGELSPVECYSAAWILNHGETVDEFALAHDLAMRAFESGVRKARWLAAAALDRGLMHQGLPQRFGTNIVPDGRRYRLWDLDPTTTDAERMEWDVPPLADLERRAREATASAPQPCLDEAPDWLKAAVLRWRSAT